MEEISVNRVLDTLVTKVKSIIIVLILGMFIGLVYSLLFIDKEYKSTATLVMPKCSLIDEYTSTIKTDAFLKDISEKFNVSISELKEKSYIDLRNKKIYTVDVIYKGKEPELVSNIANEIAQKFVAQMNTEYELKNVKVTNAAVPANKYFNFSAKIVVAKSVKTSIALVSIYLLVILSIEFFSNRIKTERFLSEDLKIKVLYTISEKDKKKENEYYNIQCKNLVNKIDKCIGKDKMVVMFSNANEVGEYFESILKELSKLNKKTILFNFDNKIEIEPIENIDVKKCTESEIHKFIDEYEVVLINVDKIDGISFEEKMFDLVNNIIIFVKRSKTQIADLELSTKIINDYNKLDNTYCIMVGEDYLTEYRKYKKFKNK